MKIVDAAFAFAPKSKLETVGIRLGEKLHEQLIDLLMLITPMNMPSITRFCQPFMIGPLILHALMVGSWLLRISPTALITILNGFISMLCAPGSNRIAARLGEIYVQDSIRSSGY